MRKLIFSLAAGALILAGCAETTAQKTTVRKGPLDHKGLPVEIHLPTEEGLVVQVELKDKGRIPVELQMPQGEGIPVRLEAADDKRLPVDVKIRDDKAFAVEVKTEGGRMLPVQLQMDSDKPLSVGIRPDKLTKRAFGLSIFAVVGTVLAAIGAWKAARNTRLAAEGQLFFDLMKEYGSHETRDDMCRLFGWFRDNDIERQNEAERDNRADAWVKRVYDEKEDDAIGIDKARRHLTHYFLGVLDLEESRYVGVGFAKRICRAVGTRVLDVLEPLERATIRRRGELEGKSKNEVRQEIEDLKSRFKKLRDFAPKA